MVQFSVGLDLGQKQDPTAIAIVERTEAAKGFDRVTLDAGDGDAIPPEAPGTGNAGNAVSAGGGARARAGAVGKLAGRCALAADATGVGAPVMDLLRAAGLGCELVAVTITGGDRAVRADDGWRVPKRDLVVGLQVMLEAESLRIAAGLRDARRSSRN